MSPGGHAADHLSIHGAEGAARDQGLGGVRGQPPDHAVVHPRRAHEHRYRTAGLGFTASARYESTFQGTFVRVRRHGRDVVGGFAEGSVLTIIAIPMVAVCE
jgi:hypothetical protein